MIYLDYAATTPLDHRVVVAMQPYLEGFFGNPNSLYAIGREASRHLEQTREVFASQIGAAQPSEVIFTGCGTESDNTAILGLARAAKQASGRNHLVVSAFEHKGVLAPAELLAKQGFELTFVQPDPGGVVRPEALEAVVTQNTALVSVMHVNNELGTIQPIRELAAVSHGHGALFHSDAVQSIGKVQFDVADSGVDSASFSAHKFYGPRGVGALFLRQGVAMQPLLIGGGQEAGKRSGTQNLASIVGMTAALEIINAEREIEGPRLTELRDKVIAGIADGVENTRLNGSVEALAPHIANFIVEGVEGASLLLHLDHAGIFVATASACSSGSPKPSHVLLAIGCSAELAQGAMRVSVGRDTTAEDIDVFLEKLLSIVGRLRGRTSGGATLGRER